VKVRIGNKWYETAGDIPSLSGAEGKYLRVVGGKLVWATGGGGGGADWGDIGGTLSAQTDLQSALDGKVPTTRTVNAKALSSNITLDKTDIGLSNVPNTDATDPANISQNASYRFVTDAEKTTWNGKQDALVSGTNIKTVNGNSLLGSGDLSVSASAGGSNTQVQYNNAGALAGDAGMTYDSATDVLTVVGSVNTPSVQATSSAGGTLKSNSGATCMDWGAGSGQNVTFEDGVKLNASTASRLLSTDASKNILALDTATYPSLTEVSYVKGVTSAIQTQINAKGDAIGIVSANADNIVAFDGAGGKQLKQLPGANGEILYHNGTQWTRLSAGTLGQVLQSNGAAAPTWVTPTTGQSLCKYNQFYQNLAVTNVAATIGTKTLTVAQGDTFEVLVSGYIFNNSGATRSYNIQLDIGGTIMTTTASTTIAAAARASIYYRGVVHVYDDTVIYMNALYTPLAASADNASATATMRHSWRQVGVDRTGSQAVSAAIISSNTGTQTFNGSIMINQIPSIS